MVSHVISDIFPFTLWNKKFRIKWNIWKIREPWDIARNKVPRRETIYRIGFIIDTGIPFWMVVRELVVETEILGPGVLFLLKHISRRKTRLIWWPRNIYIYMYRKSHSGHNWCDQGAEHLIFEFSNCFKLSLLQSNHLKIQLLRLITALNSAHVSILILCFEIEYLQRALWNLLS